MADCEDCGEPLELGEIALCGGCNTARGEKLSENSGVPANPFEKEGDYAGAELDEDW